MSVSEHAFIVIFGGSFAATLIRFPFSSIMHGLPLGAKFAFSMRRMTQRELSMKSPASAEVARKSGPVGSEKSRPTIPFSPRYPLRRRRLRYEFHPRRSRARSRQLPHPSRRGSEDLPCGRRLRAGLRHDRHPDRYGADVRQHDGSLEARPIHGGRAACNLYRRGAGQSVLSTIADKLHLKLVDEEINRTLMIDGILMIREANIRPSCAKCRSPICPRNIVTAKARM